METGDPGATVLRSQTATGPLRLDCRPTITVHRALQPATTAVAPQARDWPQLNNARTTASAMLSSR